MRLGVPFQHLRDNSAVANALRYDFRSGHKRSVTQPTMVVPLSDGHCPLRMSEGDGCEELIFMHNIFGKHNPIASQRRQLVQPQVDQYI